MNILLVRTGGLGDALVTLPVAQRIKELYPGSKLHVLGNETMLEVARLSGIFDGFYSYDTGSFSDVYSSSTPSEFLRSFFPACHTVYFFTAAEKEKIITKVVGSGACFCHILDPREPPYWRRHITEHLMTILGSSCSLSTIPVISRKIEKKRSGVVMHTGSGSIKKNWPLERYIHVAERVDNPVTFILGPAELDRGIEKTIPWDCFNFLWKNTLADVCDELAGAEVYIGNDSGISHLAAMCSTPSIILFGPTDPAVWSPLGKDVNVVYSKDGTMESISADEVMLKLEILLENDVQPQKSREISASDLLR